VLLYCLLQDKLPQNVVDDIQTAIKDVRAAQEAEDLSDLRAQIKALSDASMKIGESLNQGSSSGSSGSSDSSSGSSGTSQ
jgi:hypothetical protein